MPSSLSLHEELVEGMEVSVAGAQEAPLVEEVGDVGRADSRSGGDGEQKVAVAGLKESCHIVGDMKKVWP